MASRTTRFERTVDVIRAAHLLFPDHSRERRSGRDARPGGFFREAGTGEREAVPPHGRGTGRYDLAHTIGTYADKLIDSSCGGPDGARHVARTVCVRASGTSASTA